jgi:hypothetical protein
MEAFSYLFANMTYFSRKGAKAQSVSLQTIS